MGLTCHAPSRLMGGSEVEDHPATVLAVFQNGTTKVILWSSGETIDGNRLDPSLMLRHRQSAGRSPQAVNRMIQQPAVTTEVRNAPGRIRIPNLLIRSQVLYPVELRALA